MSRDLSREFSQQDALNIVILGGSFAGLSAAHHFLSKTIDTLRITKSAPKYRVVLISPSTHLYWNIGAPRALVSPTWIPRDASFIAIEPGFRRYPNHRFKFLQASATSVDFVQRVVHVQSVVLDGNKKGHNRIGSTFSQAGTNRWSTGSKGTTGSQKSIQEAIPFHALILATGTHSESPLYSLHGPHENTVASLDDFHERVPSAESVIIAGGGPSGVETAGQLATYFNSDNKAATSIGQPDIKPVEEAENEPTTPAKRDSKISIHSKRNTPAGAARSQRKPKVITLISGNERLLPKLPPAIGDAAEVKLKRLGVHILHNRRVLTSQELPASTSSGRGKTRCVLNDTTSIAADLYVAATGVYPNTAYLPAELLDASGYVNVDPQYLRVEGSVGDRVFALGDCAAYSKNYVLDVYEAVPTLLHNLRNDLWEYEIRLQNPYGGQAVEREIDKLTDMVYTQNPTDTQLIPITRYGGVGVMFGHKLPSLLVHLMKGRDYRIGKAKIVATQGHNPYAPDTYVYR